MNRIKTFLIFLGYYTVFGIGIQLLAYISNKIFDNVSDFLYIPTLGIFLGYFPLYYATEKALEKSKYYNETKMVILILFSIFSILSIIAAVIDIWGRIKFNNSLFGFIDQSNLHNHWLYFLPFGISMAVSLLAIWKDE